jgi:hypothetical protein
MNKHLTLCLICLFLTVSCKNVPNTPPSHLYLNIPQNLSFKIIDAPNKTFGYDIYADGKLVIHQPHAPAMQGMDGFKSNERAIKVANLVIKKIKRGEMPPTVTHDELKKLDTF